VVRYVGHSAKVVKHVGNARDKTECDLLINKAQEWIVKYTLQSNLFPEQKQNVLIVERSECVRVTHDFAYQFFKNCIRECQLAHLPPLLLDLPIIRLIEPASKLRSIELLSRYFEIKYSQRIYRSIPKLISWKVEIEQRAYSAVRQLFKEQFCYVLYDVTTLYFESFKPDDLKIQGFSKDNKSQQPQIVIGLLVTQAGFTLTYDVFAGNTFKGKTMLPVGEEFIAKHPDTKSITVADAAMLDNDRLSKLREKGLTYIVGARLANADLGKVKQIYCALNAVNGAITRLNSRHGDLICDFSTKRYTKELNELNRLVKKVEDMVAKQSSDAKTKFIKRVSKEKIELNTFLIEKRRLLLGIKGYCTNLHESQMSSQQVIERNHHLWRVEQSFRMSKHDLETLPIYHQKEDAIRSHVLICFLTLIIEKYLELTTHMTLRNIRLLVWSITESHIRDSETGVTFKFASPTAELMESIGSINKKVETSTATMSQVRMDY
jgi:transposase